jgi:hypothetical protein
MTMHSIGGNTQNIVQNVNQYALPVKINTNNVEGRQSVSHKTMSL